MCWFGNLNSYVYPEKNMAMSFFGSLFSYMCNVCMDPLQIRIHITYK